MKTPPTPPSGRSPRTISWPRSTTRSGSRSPRRSTTSSTARCRSRAASRCWNSGASSSHQGEKEIRMRWVGLATFLAIVAVRAGAAREPDVAKQLVGTWQLTKAVVGGNALPDEVVKNLRLELIEGKYRVIGAESP